jgi:hypothetical protein
LRHFGIAGLVERVQHVAEGVLRHRQTLHVFGDVGELRDKPLPDPERVPALGLGLAGLTQIVQEDREVVVACRELVSIGRDGRIVGGKPRLDQQRLAHRHRGLASLLHTLQNGAEAIVAPRQLAPVVDGPRRLRDQLGPDCDGLADLRLRLLPSPLRSHEVAE